MQANALSLPQNVRTAPLQNTITTAPQHKCLRAACPCKIIQGYWPKPRSKQSMHWKSSDRHLKVSNWKFRATKLQTKQPSKASRIFACREWEVNTQEQGYYYPVHWMRETEGEQTASANYWKSLQNTACLQNHLPRDRHRWEAGTHSLKALLGFWHPPLPLGSRDAK